MNKHVRFCSLARDEPCRILDTAKRTIFIANAKGASEEILAIFERK